MFTGDIGGFALMWILVNLFFLLSFIVGGVMLTKWLARRSLAKKQRLQTHPPAKEVHPPSNDAIEDLQEPQPREEAVREY